MPNPEERYRLIRRNTFAALHEVTNGWTGHAMVACCGRGGEALLLRANAGGSSAHITGIDTDSAAIRDARSRYREANIGRQIPAVFRVEDIESTDIAPSSYDVVVCLFGVEYLRNPEHTVDVWTRSLRPDGRLFVASWSELVRPKAATHQRTLIANGITAHLTVIGSTP